MTDYVRKAAKAGAWYTGCSRGLSRDIDGYYSKVDINKQDSRGKTRAAICPHAGYAYSGPGLAHSFSRFDPRGIRTVFVLGPSHRLRIRGCHFFRSSSVETPLGSLLCDVSLCADLNASLNGKSMDNHWICKEDDEDEHSLEMMFPMIKHAVNISSRRESNGVDGGDGLRFNHAGDASSRRKSRDVDGLRFKHAGDIDDASEESSGIDGDGGLRIVPMLVGAMSAKERRRAAEVLGEYVARDDVFFVLSSDFCHWGKRFGYTYYEKEHGDIYRSIETVDRRGMDAISTLDVANVEAYFERTENTICGRNPIMLYMEAIDAIGKSKDGSVEVDWVSYYQSSRCVRASDSSVSYASGHINFL